MKKQSEQYYRIGFILIILAAVICFLVIIVKTGIERPAEKDGLYIQKDDAYLLFGYLCTAEEELAEKELDTAAIRAAVTGELSQNNIAKDGLSKAEAIYMFEVLKALYPLCEGELIRLQQSAYAGYGRDKDCILSADYMDEYEKIWNVVHSGSPLLKTELIPLGYGTDVQTLHREDFDFKELSENSFCCIIPDDPSENSKIRTAVFAKSFPVTEKNAANALYQTRCCLMTEDTVLWDCSDYHIMHNEDFVLEAVFIASVLPEGFLIESGDFRFPVQGKSEEADPFEKIADFHFQNGALSAMDIYNVSVSGKLLCIKEDSVELEGTGIYPYDDRFPVYKLYGEKEYYTQSDLKIGYDFTDFVLNHDGKIVAGLVTREEKMESIRVLIKTSGFAGAYHETVTLSCDQSFLVNGEKHPAGEELTFSMSDDIFENERVYIKPETNLAKTSIHSVERSQGVPAYRGSFEIVKTEEGLLLINELLLEEYLYSVVPSEMPSSYPAEALKAQAVSARTYAYDKMCHASLQACGAHVDDSAAFQVYNNINENENTTFAIRETQGQILTVNGHTAETYYYSTSCGYGTDIDAWHGSNADAYRYMISKRLSDEQNGRDAEDMRDETIFREYMSQSHAEDFESEEGWYRWVYESDLNIDRLNQNLLKRYEAGSKNIVTLNGNQEYEQSTPPVFTKINRMEVTKRESGGVMDELLLSGPEGTVKVIGEHNIRAALANETDHVVRANGSNGSISGLLPSAFGYLDVIVDKETNSVRSYRVTGGGFGHGIGMSQNGARAMADRGWSCDDILGFFFENSRIGLLDIVP